MCIRDRGKAMARVNLKPERMGKTCPSAQGGKFGGGLNHAALGVQIGIMAGVQFHHRRACLLYTSRCV